METVIDDYEKLLRLTDGMDVEHSLGDDGLEFTVEDVTLLTKIWAEIVAKNPKPIICKTMSDEETLEFFGLSQ